MTDEELQQLADRLASRDFWPEEDCLSDCYKNQVHSVLCIHYNQHKKE